MVVHTYQDAKIYKIWDNCYNECYIGSTKGSLSQRMARHRHCYNSWKRDKRSLVTVYKMFDESGIDNCKIELVADYPCNNLQELRKREGEYIRSEACVNKRVKGRSRKEYHVDNRETLLKQHRRYYEEHRETRLEHQREYN
jgi:hypothetical protein